jgi:hypothetical protein
MSCLDVINAENMTVAHDFFIKGFGSILGCAHPVLGQKTIGRESYA